MPPPSTRAWPCVYLWLAAVRLGSSARHRRDGWQTARPRAAVACRGNADVGDHQLAYIVAAREQKMAGLGAVKSHGERGRSRGPQNRAAVAMDPGGDVDRDHRHAGASYRLDRVSCDAIQRACEAGAEQAVDHEPGILDQLGLQRQHAAVPGGAAQRGVAAQAIPGAKQGDLDRPAVLRDAARPRSRRRRCCPGRRGRASAAAQSAPRSPEPPPRRVLHQRDARHARRRSRPHPPPSSPQS